MREYSIIVPTYPPDFYLLHSLVKQINSFTIENHYKINEIIFAASEITEFEATIIEEELKNISKYKVIVNSSEEKCNAAKNRNRGWESVTGEWIVFLDCDDIYHKDKIKVTNQAIEKHKDSSLFLHSYLFGYEYTEIDNLFNRTLNLEDDIYDYGDNVYKKTFPEGKWIDIEYAYNGNTNLSSFIPRFAHGISTVKASCTSRYPENFKIGEDGLFCRTVCFNYGEVIITNLPLMIYNLS